MSTDWGIGCRTCFVRQLQHSTSTCPVRDTTYEYFTGEWDNCRDVGALQNIVDARREIVALWKKLGQQSGVFWSADFRDGREAHRCAEFFSKHEGHDLAPMDEYGRFHDQCDKWVHCDGCGRSASCVLHQGHSVACRAVP